MATPSGLLDDLHDVGCHVGDLWELVNSNSQYSDAVPVLLDWLQHLDDRIAEAEWPKVREGLVRALTVRSARPAAAPVMIEQFRTVQDSTDLGLRWTIGNALSEVADDSVFDDIEILLRDRRYGRARQMIALYLGRSKDPRAVQLLLDLLADDDVVAHALDALSKLKPPGCRSRVEALLQHPRPLVRNEAKKALKRLPP